MRNQALVIGSFVAASLVLVVVGILWLSGGHLFQHQLAAVINFKDGVAGLYKGAPVTFRGVPVGQVASIELELDRDTGAVRIPVHVLLSGDIVKSTSGRTEVSALADLRRAVHDGLRAKLVLQSVVTGQKSIELNLLPKAPSATIPPGLPVEIPVVADNFAALEDQLQDLPVTKIAADLLKTMESVRTTMAAAGKALEAAGTTLAGAGRDFGAVGKDAHRTLAAADLALANVEGSADKALAALTRLADHADGTISAIRPDLLHTLSASREAATSARTALAQVSRLTAPEGPLGDDLHGAVTDFAAAARSLRDWSELVDDKPNALIFGRQQPARDPP